ncbi:RmlC-like cupin [Polychaeton citri CBS 116435]|uniref:RmlC-like cupin n=1 Tax=Polychaeton citri CBS 116435 TaxID=1314669 RepID=A0A9P4UKZ4_9PEZI|nr:RmlC-like cupin [Polychaeton citri CBS 116435]
MSAFITKLSFAALAFAIANAAPAPQYPSGTRVWTTAPYPSGTGSASTSSNGSETYSTSSYSESATYSTSSYSESATSTGSCSLGIPAQVIVDPAVASAKASDNAALAKELLSEVTQVDRFNRLLTVDGAGKELLDADTVQDRVVFNFNKANQTGEGGRLLVANEKNFPILVDLGISTAVAFLEPCGMNSPHTHPRATEFLTVVQGSLKAGFMLENAFVTEEDKAKKALTTQISAELSAFEATVFPQGSIHFQFNDNCEPAAFVASLTSSDPGTSQIAQNFFFQDDEIVDIVLGKGEQTVDGANIEEFRSKLPSNLVRDMDKCMQRCNLK